MSAALLLTAYSTRSLWGISKKPPTRSMSASLVFMTPLEVDLTAKRMLPDLQRSRLTSWMESRKRVSISAFKE